jgi:hypothetical protein
MRPVSSIIGKVTAKRRLLRLFFRHFLLPHIVSLDTITAGDFDHQQGHFSGFFICRKCAKEAAEEALFVVS